jgi:ATP-binding cassette subfamily F protein 3
MEEFLQQYQGAMMIISHDRSFLDRVTTKTWELSLGRLATYKGNYSHYLTEKALRMEMERSSYDNQQAMIRQTEQFITRFKAKSTKAKQVQSRVKQLEKIERIELSETERTIHFAFPPAAPSGRDVLELNQVSKEFNGRTIFNNVSLTLRRGDKLAVVGVNGVGKTTLMKIMAGLESADGNVRQGHNVIMTYFGQHQAQELDGQYSILDTVYHNAQDMTVTKVRSLLGAFLFTGDDVDKKVQVLSGGEKSRVALAKMLIKPANLMMLDEPTNHLDISSQEVLQEAMAQYEGTIIVVSHNRSFVNSFANKVLEIRNQQAFLHDGNLDDYLETRKRIEDESKTVVRSAKAAAPKAVAIQPVAVSVERKEDRKQQAQQREQLNALLKPWKKKAADAEKEIERLESQKIELESLMADPNLYANQQQWAKTSKEYGEVKQLLERQYAAWEEAQGKIEGLEKGE